MRATYTYKREGFWRSLWLVLHGWRIESYRRDAHDGDPTDVEAWGEVGH